MEIVTPERFRANKNNEQRVEQPFKEVNLTPFGIDLTAGEYCVHLTKDLVIKLVSEAEVEVRPGDSVIVETEERLDVPPDWVGLIFPKRKLTEDGLFQPGGGGKVDPGWNNRLKVAFKNEGYKTIKLKRGTRICCVAFWQF